MSNPSQRKRYHAIPATRNNDRVVLRNASEATRQRCSWNSLNSTFSAAANNRKLSAPPRSVWLRFTSFSKRSTDPCKGHPRRVSPMVPSASRSEMPIKATVVGKPNHRWFT